MDFGKLFGRAKEQAGKHSDQVHQGVDKAQDLAGKHLDDKYDGHIEKAGDAVEKGLGLDPTSGGDAEPEPRQ